MKIQVSSFVVLVFARYIHELEDSKLRESRGGPEDGEPAKTSPADGNPKCHLDGRILRGMIPWNHYYHLIPGHNKMGRGGVQCVRISFIVLNVLVCLFSCAALGLGIWLQIHTSGTTRLIAQYATISSAAFMIAVGCIGILVCIMGCCGSWSVNRCLLMLYFIIVLGLFLAEIGLAIYFLIFRDTLTDNFRYEQKLAIRTNYLPHSTLAKVWDSIQEDFGCCGMDSPADWYYIAAWPELQVAPDSCCVPEARRIPNCGKSVDFRTIYPRGCYEVVRDYVTRNMYIFAVSAVVLAFIQLFGLVSSMVLFCAGNQIQQEKLVIVTREEPEFVEVRQTEPLAPLTLTIKPAYVETNL